MGLWGNVPDGLLKGRKKKKEREIRSFSPAPKLQACEKSVKVKDIYKRNKVKMNECKEEGDGARRRRRRREERMPKKQRERRVAKSFLLVKEILEIE